MIKFYYSKILIIVHNSGTYNFLNIYFMQFVQFYYLNLNFLFYGV